MSSTMGGWECQHGVWSTDFCEECYDYAPDIPLLSLVQHHLGDARQWLVGKGRSEDVRKLDGLRDDVRRRFGPPNHPDL